MGVSIWTSLLAAIAVFCIGANATGIVKTVECYGKYANFDLSTDSDFASKFVDPDHHVQINSMYSTNTSCQFAPTATATKFQANYADCNAVMTDVQLLNSDWQEAQINFKAVDLYFVNNNPVQDIYTFQIRCSYQHNTVINGSGTNINGGGGGGGGGGNNTGGVNGSSIVEIVIGTPATARVNGKLVTTVTPISTANLGAPLTITFNMVPNKDLYKAILPYYCAFSNSGDANNNTAAVFPFLDTGCPQEGINSLGQKIVTDWNYDAAQNVFAVNFNAFKYANVPQLFFHCTINLCVNDDCTPEIAGSTKNCQNGWGPSPSQYQVEGNLHGSLMMARHLKMMRAAKNNGFTVQTMSLGVSKASKSYTIWYAAIGVVGGLFVVSIFAVGALMTQRRRRSAVRPSVPMAPAMVPVAMAPMTLPRAHLDPESLPGSSRGSVNSGFSSRR